MCVYIQIRWPKYWSFSFSIRTSSENSELISFRIDWFDFLAVQGTLKSLLQHHTWKASIVQHSAFLKFPWSRKWGNTHSSILAFRIPWREEPGLLQSKGLQRIGHDWATELNWTELLLGRKPMTNLDTILRSRDITWLTKVHLVKGYGFPKSRVWMRELDHKESWALKNWCLNCDVEEGSWESLILQGDPTSPS